ncbi:MAG TPA: lytic transglycosylase domain-containing protein, partial [Solirubrobacterales bacterium]|nr:lytic transglycosylase domain-containing protein [Solirubrobacterales bacterium]
GTGAPARGTSMGGGDGLLNGAGGLPDFVPAEYRGTILRAASEWNVSAALLSAQLQAESNFDPNVVSSAGAQGIAQFMPGTADSYGLADPFDPHASIMAQAEMMAELLGQFGSAELALAAYNAGPGAVSPCNCIPDYPETIAYVQKIAALLSGLGGLGSLGGGLHLPLEVRLVD